MRSKIDANGVKLAQERSEWQNRKNATSDQYDSNQTARMRTSWQKVAPSGWTDEQVRDRSDRLGRDAWLMKGLLVININDLRLDDIDRGMIKALAAKIGFGNFRGI